MRTKRTSSIITSRVCETTNESRSETPAGLVPRAICGKTETSRRSTSPSISDVVDDALDVAGDIRVRASASTRRGRLHVESNASLRQQGDGTCASPLPPLETTTADDAKTRVFNARASEYATKIEHAVRRYLLQSERIRKIRKRRVEIESVSSGIGERRRRS